MAKVSALDRTAASIQSEIDMLERVLAKLREHATPKSKPTAVRKPRAVKPPQQQAS